MGGTFRARIGRAAVAALAAYALLLQAFLAAATPARALALVHGGVLCSPADGERRASPASPADDRPAACGEACCLAAPPAAPPPPAAAAPGRRSVVVLASAPPAVAPFPSARPPGAASARGPPPA